MEEHQVERARLDAESEEEEERAGDDFQLGERCRVRMSPMTEWVAPRQVKWEDAYNNILEFSLRQEWSYGQWIFSPSSRCIGRTSSSATP